MEHNERVTITPILGSDAQLYSILIYEEKTEHRDMAIHQAHIDGLVNQELANALNQKYVSQATALYSDYLHRVDSGAQNITYLANYSLKANNGITAAIELSKFIAEASGAQSYEYDNLDMKNGYYITLPSLFKNDTYVELISEEIKRQMNEQMARNPDIIYFTDESGFNQIDPNQQFYINNAHLLVIVFDEYTIAPGVMGAIEFVIPTPVISGILANNLYID